LLDQQPLEALELRAGPKQRREKLCRGRRRQGIEDLLGVDDYVVWVNQTYSSFGWFQPISAADVTATRGTQSLGRALEVLFLGRFGKDFSKMSVAVMIADAWWQDSVSVPDHVINLIGQIIVAAG
jgi:hypothetical protein